MIYYRHNLGSRSQYTFREAYYVVIPRPVQNVEGLWFIYLYAYNICFHLITNEVLFLYLRSIRLPNSMVESFQFATSDLTFSQNSSPAVHLMSPQQRGCLFPDDDLKSINISADFNAFKNYSYYACLLECKAKTIMDYCNCLPYYFPDFSGTWNKSTDCNVKGLKCINDVGCKMFFRCHLMGSQ